MGLLRCDGVFAAPVPDGWNVGGVPGSDYVLTPKGSAPGDEIRLAVFPRDDEPLGEREGADRLLELLAELGVEASEDSEEIDFRARYDKDSHRAFAWFQASDAAGRDVDVLAAVVVLPRAIVAATALASPRRPEVIATAEVLVASITADKRRGRRR